MEITAYVILCFCVIHFTEGTLTRKIPRVPGRCGDTQSGLSGSFASPNFPHGHYPPRSSCNYTVTVPEGKAIKFEFIYMDMEDAPVQKLGSCFADYLVITEANKEESTMVGGQRFCGINISFKPVYTKGNRAYVWFRTDDSDQFQGFVLKWTAVKPLVPQFECNFESKQGFCQGWEEMGVVKTGRWQVAHGRTRSNKNGWITGPSFDHTKKNKAGAFAYVEATGMRPKEQASLLSAPAKVTVSERYCFSFWYHMYGSGIGSLTVYESREEKGAPARRGNVVFDMKGEQGPGWIRAQITINRRSQPLRFIFEVTRGRNYRGDIAIDDITLSDDACPGPK